MQDFDGISNTDRKQTGTRPSMGNLLFHIIQVQLHYDRYRPFCCTFLCRRLQTRFWGRELVSRLLHRHVVARSRSARHVTVEPSIAYFIDCVIADGPQTDSGDYSRCREPAECHTQDEARQKCGESRCRFRCCAEIAPPYKRNGRAAHIVTSKHLLAVQIRTC